MDKRPAKLSQSLEDYLEAIYIIAEEKKVVRVKDLVQKLGVKSSSVIGALKKLKELGLVVQEHYGYIELTGEGMIEGDNLYRKHTLLFRFFSNLLGINEKNAENDACSIEHHISNESLEKILKLTEFFEKNNRKEKFTFEELRKNIR